MGTATGYLRPDADITANWYGPVAASHYAAVDDVVFQPTIEGTGDYINNDQYLGDDNVEDVFTYSSGGGSISDIDSIDKVIIWQLGHWTASGGSGGPFYPEMQYSIDSGSTWLPSTPDECSSMGNGTIQWDSYTISSPSWTQDQLNNIRVKYIADTPRGDKNASDFNFIAVSYVEVRYQTPSTGWSGKVNTVSSPASVNTVTNIGKVNTI